MSENLTKLKAILREMFQLDQADLDFGIYRIMNQKREEIEQFLDRDLLPQVKTAFAQFEGEDLQAVRDELDKLKKTLDDAGVVAETSPKFQALQAKLSQSVDVTNLENEVFSQLTNFFRRYYQGGDFLSLRRYKAGVYAIPYEGEEVKLHWANADQYYIKSSENFRDYTFKLPSGKRAHFKLVDASTEQNNKKEQAGKERRFMLCTDSPVVEEAGELCIRFEYKVDEAGAKQTALNEAAVQTVFNLLPHSQVEGGADWKRELSSLAPTEKNPRRTLLEKHLNDYTAKYSFDYFIHKDLGGFLRRELDFFIKNEVLFIDDLDVDHVRVSISKVKVIKEIGHKVIAFLEQLENFQKKLWLKKKFVVETGYCCTLDKVPSALLPAISENSEQIQEWIKLGFIEEGEVDGLKKWLGEEKSEVGRVKGETDLFGNPVSSPSFTPHSSPFTFLVLDTAFYDQEFTEKLLASFDNLEQATDGVLVNCENFQALITIQNRYSRSIQATYIDPPYNTSASEIIYKNSYKDSSWLSFIENRVKVAKQLMSPDGILCVTIDDFEFHRLRQLLTDIFGNDNILGLAAIRSNPAGRSTAKGFSIAHEYGIFVANSANASIGRLERTEEQIARYGEVDENGAFEWVNFRKHGGANAERVARPKLFYPIFASHGNVRIPEIEWDNARREWTLLEQPLLGEEVIYPVNSKGEEKTWKWGSETAKEKNFDLCSKPDQTGGMGVYSKSRLNDEGTLPLTWWDKKVYSATEYGTNLLARILGASNLFSFPKSVHAVEDSLKVSRLTINDYALDFFAGSGTTAHAVINQNREDNGNRKYILVEMGEHFDAVLKPRIQKVIYSKDWKDGKPVSRQGSSHFFKYIRLESYEDALNNLRLNRTPEQGSLLEQHDSLREQYLLSYMLDVESAGSASLLNIDAFTNPFNYRMNIARGNETKETVVDLVETFNWLLGIKVLRISQKEHRTAEFETDSEGRLQIKGRSRTCAAGEGWTFQEVEGQTLSGDKVLVIWRTCTTNPEQDNVMLDEWFGKRNYSTLDFEFGRIYVNGDNNLENLKVGEERWKVALIEEEFKRLMFDVEGV